MVLLLWRGGIAGLLWRGGTVSQCCTSGRVRSTYCDETPRCGGIVGEDWREGDMTSRKVYSCVNHCRS